MVVVGLGGEGRREPLGVFPGSPSTTSACAPSARSEEPLCSVFSGLERPQDDDDDEEALEDDEEAVVAEEEEEDSVQAGRCFGGSSVASETFAAT